MADIQENQLQVALAACKSSFLSVGFFSIFVNALMLVPTFYMIQISGRVVPSNSTSTLIVITAVMTWLVVTQGLLQWVRSKIMVRASNRMDVILSPHVYRASFNRALKSGGSDATAQSLNDLTSLRQFITSHGLFSFFDAPWFPIYTAVMFYFHPWLGWFTIFCGAVLVVLAFVNNRITGKAHADVNKDVVATNVTTQKTLRNAEVIESMGMLEKLMNRWASRQQGILKLQSDVSDQGKTISSISKAFRIWSQSIALAITAYLVVKHEINPGLLIAGSLLLSRALAPVDQIIASWKGFVQAKVQYKRLTSVLAELGEKPKGAMHPAPAGNIEVKDLVVTPPGGKTPVLHEVSFDVPAGSIVGVIGPSAAGKSSLARALMNIWPKQSGEILLDGIEISSWDKRALGPYVGYLPQDIELFEGSISENISRFEEVDSEKVVEAAKTAGVHEMILLLPEGYDTVIGSEGINLSGGQRQRIGLARAIYRNPRLIVLDEPNSNLDEIGERALSVALRKLKEAGSTIFVVSHRPSVLTVVDRILVMADGKVSLYGERDAVIGQLARQNAATQKRAAPLAVVDGQPGPSPVIRGPSSPGNVSPV
ncbi:type I secretion system permease/ATPase [Pseudomonas alloputida]|uniref:type I secretion system permease/ATPase n=1 Tax=Pseudomonas alloputida TaxID=1940621 RepID=UPI0038661BE1